MLRFVAGLLLLSCLSVSRVDCQCDGHQSGHDAHHHFAYEPRLHPFDHIANGSFLSLDRFEKFVHEIFDHLTCGNGGDHGQAGNGSRQLCNETLCIDVAELSVLVGGDSSGVNEDQLRNASLVLLYLVTELEAYCHQQVNLTALTVEGTRSTILTIVRNGFTEAGHIHASGMEILLDSIKDRIYMGEASTNMDDDDDDDHHHDDDHDDDDDHHHGDDDDDGHGDDHGHGHEHEFGLVLSSLVTEPGCLAPDAILYYMQRDFIEEDIETHTVEEMAELILYLISQGAVLKPKCRTLPIKQGFMVNLFTELGGTDMEITSSQFERLLVALNIQRGGQGHSHGESHGHVHSRRKRNSDLDLSTPEGAVQQIANTQHSRVRRQTSQNDLYKTCYTTDQLLALFDVPDNIGHQRFQQMCPALISQALYADCSTLPAPSSISEAEKYGYSFLVTFILVMLAVLGAVLMPCAGHRVYHALMAFFVGLAVGSLYADAILHMIPMVFGIHVHAPGGHGHGHDHDIEVEDFVRYGLVIIAALYLFYIIELILNQCGQEPEDTNSDNLDSELDKDHTKENGTDPNQKNLDTEVKSPTGGCCNMRALVLNIVFGGVIHNLSNGLAIGAAFSTSVSAGLSTSVAVLCHEIPHELADFSVLIQSGCSYPKAVCLNLLSSMSTFVGLYVSLAVTQSTEQATENWIFAIAAGMFFYIALTDLLPQLIKSKGYAILFNNLGFLLGIGIMLVIVIYEEHINI